MISLLNSGWGEPLGIVKRLWENRGESVRGCWVCWMVISLWGVRVS